MNRSSRAPRQVPTSLVERARNASSAPPAARSSHEQKPWFRIENKTDTSADIYIYDEIDSWWGVSAQSFLAEVRDLDVSQINLHVNSPGGDVFEAVTIYNTLVNHKAKVVVYVDGLAASAASFIAQAGDEVIMGLGSMMMIHDAAGLAWGNAEDMRGTAEVLDKISDTISEFYAHRAGGTAEEWRGIMKQEAWYSAQEAVEAGLADRVLQEPVSDEKVENRWNLSVFNYAGRQNAPSPGIIRQTVLNQITKEKQVATNANETETVEEIETEQPAVESTPETTGVEPAQPVELEVEPAAPVAPAPTESATVENKAGFALIVNGQRVTDPKAIQAHIDTLEGFARESKDAARRSFVENLASDGKIGAPQVEAMQTLALTLSDEQYETFRASWDAAPKLPLLGKHGVQNQEDATGIAAKRDRLKVLQDIVQHHRNSGMKEADIQAKDSYIEMQALQAELDG